MKRQLSFVILSSEASRPIRNPHSAIRNSMTVWKG